jgi:hypothetical protein
VKRITLLLLVLGGIARLFFISSLVTCAPVKDKIRWETVSEKGFSVLMPGKPVKGEESTTSSAGPITAHTFKVDVEREEYSLTYTDYPHTPRMDSIEPAKIFDFSRDKVLAMRTTRKVLTEKEISLNGYPGRELIYEDPTEPSINIVRLYWAKPRLYLVVFARLKTESLSGNAQKFLDSFKILSQQ